LNPRANWHRALLRKVFVSPRFIVIAEWCEVYDC
jgi:hypothetical protein